MFQHLKCLDPPPPESNSSAALSSITLESPYRKGCNKCLTKLLGGVIIYGCKDDIDNVLCEKEDRGKFGGEEKKRTKWAYQFTLLAQVCTFTALSFGCRHQGTHPSSIVRSHVDSWANFMYCFPQSYSITYYKAKEMSAGAKEITLSKRTASNGCWRTGNAVDENSSGGPGQA